MRRIFLPVVLTFIGIIANRCEFFSEPAEQPANIIVKQFFIEPEDTLIINLTTDLSVVWNNPEITLIEPGDTSLIKVSHLSDDNLHIYGNGLGKTTIILEIEERSDVFVVYLDIHVLAGIPVFLKMGEKFIIDPAKYFEVNLQDIDSLNIAFDSLNSVVKVNSQTQNQIVLMGGIPGITTGLLQCYKPDGFIEVKLLIETEIRHVVLGELFTSTTCINCPEANVSVDEFIQAFDSSLAIVRYHVGFPWAGDPMYAANQEENDARFSYYPLPFPIAPFLAIDGVNIYIGDGQISRSDVAIIERLATTSNVYLGHSYTVDSDSIMVGIQIYPFGEAEGTFSCWAVVIEDSIHYEGDNGETLHMEVMRDMALQNNITITSEMHLELTLLKPEGFSIDNENFHVVTFLQNENTKEIVQTNIWHDIFIND